MHLCYPQCPNPEGAPAPEFSPERAPASLSIPERANVPEFSPERAPASLSIPERANVPEFSPERAPASLSIPEKANVPEFSPERAPVSPTSPERAPVSKSNPKRNSVPKSSPLVTISVVGSLRVCQSPSVYWLEDSLSPPPASESRTPPQPIGSTMAASSLISAVTWQSLQLCLGLASTILHLGTPLLRLRLVPLAPSGSDRLLHPFSSTFVLCYSGSTVAPRIHTSTIGQPFLLHGSSLCQLHRGPSSWLWPGSRLDSPVASPSCRLPGSSVWSTLVAPWLLPPSFPAWTLFVVLLSGVRPPHEPPLRFPLSPPSVFSTE
ncbi:Muscle M-line assembly protein unc-89 [Labeo rohita]|uniref:Muscle M-line assembly protein unc-89 n=1 Tax=Labeo rohita TaxID=84645 RepID=A0ABQ8LZZ0_LABRO|nr:Muscle M-line assembly protein unc-89 [Labeo rohita]